MESVNWKKNIAKFSIDCNGCKRCERNCPTGAIKILRGKCFSPHIDNSKCIGCRTCLKICPEFIITKGNKNNNLVIKENELEYDICLVTCFYSKNYGSVLSAFALYSLLTKNKFNVLLLDKPSWFWGDQNSDLYDKTEVRTFIERHCDISKIYPNLNEMYELNSLCKNFVVGSDCLFNPIFPFKDYCFLQFASSQRNKITFGTSFGNIESALKFYESNIIYKEYFQRFNHVAIRETKNLKLQKLLNVPLNEIKNFIDPVLLLPAKFYESIAQKSKKKIKRNKYLVTYFRNCNDSKAKNLKKIANKLHLKIFNIEPLVPFERGTTNFADISMMLTIPEFIECIKNASAVITDSYQCTCLSIVFKKQFLVVQSKDALSRFGVLRKLGLQDRFTNNIDNKSGIIIKKHINYNSIQSKLVEENKIANQWLKTVIEK